MKGTFMSAPPALVSDANIAWELPSRGRVGMYCLILAESAIFTIFVVAYLFYVGRSLTGPMPKDVLHAPIFFTVCLLASSLTIHFAVKLLNSAKVNAFALWWFLTLTLGAIFLAGTAPGQNHGIAVRVAWICKTGARRTHCCSGSLLAFCGRRMGGGFHGGLRYLTLKIRNSMAWESPMETRPTPPATMQ